MTNEEVKVYDPAEFGGSPQPGGGGRAARYKSKNRKTRNIIIFLLIVCLICGAAAFFTLRGPKKTASGQYILDSGEKTGISEPYVAVLHIEGEISSSGGSDSYRSYNQKWLLNRVNMLMQDPNNRGILLYADTPGGSAYACDEMYLKLKEYRDKTKRPIYTYAAEEDASAGYYISSVSDKILANRNSLVGSIGVTTGTYYDVSGLLKKLGVRTVTIHAGKNKLMGNPTKKMTKQQKQILQDMIDEAYDQFVGIVAEERGMSREQTEKLADGRIYTVKQALANGLIDGSVNTWADAKTEVLKDPKLKGCQICDLLHSIPEPTLREELLGFASWVKEPEEKDQLEIVKELMAEGQNGTTFTIAYLSDIRVGG